MIALLRGRVVQAGLGELIVDVHGIGYRLRVPPGTAGTAASGTAGTAASGTAGQLGQEIVLHTHLVVREDALTLYGFADAPARDLFETLLGVTGFGPKLALAAIGTLGADGLRRAVLTEDVDALTVVPGVGKKSAQRVILELRERLGAAPGGELPGASAASEGPVVEVREALAALGYAPVEIHRALSSLPPDSGEPVETLLRAALRALDPAAV